VIDQSSINARARSSFASLLADRGLNTVKIAHAKISSDKRDIQSHLRLALPPTNKPASDGPRVAEFFAGIGLVRQALEQVGFNVVFANDIEPVKALLYSANFDSSHFVLDDIRNVTGADIPDIELATASFPCTDLSLAGNRNGLAGSQSGMFWEFARVIEEMETRRPPLILLENVLGFATSHGGKDMADAISRLNELGYSCDILVVDALWFLPQSRQRMFIVGSKVPLTKESDWTTTKLRPRWIRDFARKNSNLRIHATPLVPPPSSKQSIGKYVERIQSADSRWWSADRVIRFRESLSSLQAKRLQLIIASPSTSWTTAYRRTRNGKAVWEIRADSVSGCLRTSRGGSSRQAVVEAGRGEFRVRWMTAREYARLQGAPNFEIGTFAENSAILGFGDAVCVPAVEWVAVNYLKPMLDRLATDRFQDA
jgi:DNA (cytosine-5)-methyltransferase 1